MKNKFIFKMVMCSIMTALSVVLGLYCKISIGDTYEITLYMIPIMFMGIVFGTKYGLLTGLLETIVEQVAFYGLGPMTIFWMLAPIAWGGMSGLLASTLNKFNIFKNKKFKWIYYLLIAFVASLFASLCNLFAIGVNNYINTKDFDEVIVLFWAGLLTRLAKLPLDTVIRGLLIYMICDRVKIYIESN